MEQICSKDLCTACAACLNICPKEAIKMVEEGAAGYVYPAIDQTLCIDCGLCVNTCPVNHPVSQHTPLKAYAAISRDEEDLMSSASGGASSLLAQEVLRNHGVIYGCGQENYRKVMHMRIEDPSDAWKIKDSKYVQSYIGTIYKQVKTDLQAGRQVMFSGTPCQVAGLRNYLRKDYPNLLLVDLVCHGVPSQKLLRDNIDEILTQSGTPDGDYRLSFRRKQRQTSGLDLRFGVFLTKDAIPAVRGRLVDFPHNNYITAFMASLIFRENCFSCPYACVQRVSDVTIADFWGLVPCTVPNNRGVSLMLVNTEKGQVAINGIRPYAQMEERPVSEAIRGNGQLQHPSKRPSERDRFLQQYADTPQLAYAENLRRYRKELRIQKIRVTLIKIVRSMPVVGSAARYVKHVLSKAK